MALTDASNNVDKKPAESKTQEKKEKPLTKVIIRRLPPNIDKETFLNQVSPVPEYNYIYMVRGDYSLGENAFSRVYINFVCPEDVYNFKERFDNYVFLDQKGHEYPAVVEFAAFQKIPKKRGKVRVDPKCATIESDPVYQEFIENINKPQEQDEKPEYTLQLNNENKSDVVDTTPLLEYIKNRRAQRLKIREARREERKKKEMERKKNIDERRKYEEKSPMKSVSSKAQGGKDKGEPEDKVQAEKTSHVEEKTEKVYEKPSPYYKNKEKKYDERKKDSKPKYSTPRKEYGDKREYKRNDDYKERDYRSKYDDYKKDSEPKAFPKKVKKYSEKREERKMEAQKKLEQQSKDKPDVNQETSNKTEENREVKVTKSPEKEEIKSEKLHEVGSDSASTSKSSEKDQKNKDNESSSSSQRRIRNKDRPTIAIYRPGMLSRRKQVDGEPENKESKPV